MVKTEKLLYSVDEACELLSVKRTKVYEWLLSGELESIKLGRRRLIPADSLREFVARSRGIGAGNDAE